ncbi:hypothetical protein AUJ66_05585 [Candidatus Desantisbacteria bacterium CG1_02_38_46]|uniref:Thioredoxin-like fold domain-containing protein n=2 Tax=unclassified Candidatus Desantisiibacteriota TaxID=3106372 RepID=A0A1J4SBC0_9BACT|nr:MAG: hypothetical protein AUJ66_05585 [Candidatus Desantisbacteria bacterium CG1_02_38_46]PIU51772.1 MAG: hypothetical protein COS91_02690 [Candidatus Desantisbacteria bacterium CG07_land_8_20_14_0_80_39_15]
MVVKIFGKDSCDVCKSMQEKFKIFLEHWNIAGRVEVKYHSIDTVDGLAEAALQDATNVPAIIIEKGGQELIRWQGRAVESKEFKPHFESLIKEGSLNLNK